MHGCQKPCLPSPENAPAYGGTMTKNAFLSVVVASFLVFALSAWSQSALPDGDGKDIVQTACVQCHELNTVTRAGYTQQGWENSIHMMINVGAALPQDQIAVVAQ